MESCTWRSNNNGHTQISKREGSLAVENLWKMTRSCAVLGCSNRSNREVDKSYYRVPKEVVHKGAKVQKISKRRREKWLSNLSLSSCGAKSKHARICSDHFVKGVYNFRISSRVSFAFCRLHLAPCFGKLVCTWQP